jgi:hypothetical protein
LAVNRQIRWATALVLLFSGLALAQQPRELGTVAWERNFPAAEKQVRASGKPMLVLFQEVPG